MSQALPRIDIDFPCLPSVLAGRVSVCVVSVPCVGGEAWIVQHYKADEEFKLLADRIRHPGRLSESLLARVARRELIRRLGIDPSRVSFSLSHTRNHHSIVAAAAMSDGPVGLDLELSARLEGRESLRGRLLVGKECESLRHLPQEQHALTTLQLWCAKESLVKAMGTGLQAPLDQYETQISGQSMNYLEAQFLRFPQWRSVVLTHREKVLSICLPRETLT